MTDALLALEFLLGAGLALATSWVLVSRIERIGARLGLSEALLGMLAAVAADAPELTAAVTALAGHHARTGAGVVIGSNVFNLAALLGVGAVVAGSIALHRRVILMEGVVAVAVAAICVVVVVGLLSAVVGLVLVLVVLVPYLVLLGVRRDRLRLPKAWRSWLEGAIHEEELELEEAVDQPAARSRDLVVAALAVAVVVGASVVMERSASELGARHAVPEIVLGGLILAGVTSLPNAVAAVYLAVRGRGAATLSTAMNSNAINVTAGLLLPASFVGLGTSSGPTTLIALYYLGLTVFVLMSAYLARGLQRAHGWLIISAYLTFAGLLLASTYSYTPGLLISLTPAVVAGIVVATRRREGVSRSPHHSSPRGR